MDRKTSQKSHSVKQHDSNHLKNPSQRINTTVSQPLVTHRDVTARRQALNVAHIATREKTITTRLEHMKCAGIA